MSRWKAVPDVSKNELPSSSKLQGLYKNLVALDDEDEDDMFL